MSAGAPNFSTNRRSSPLLGGRSFMFTKWTVRRRSAKKRWALRVSWQSLNPKIWIIGAGAACPARTEGGLFKVRCGCLERGPRARLEPKVACSRCRLAPYRPLSRALKLLPARPWHRGRAQRIAPSALRSVIIRTSGRNQVESTAQLEILARLRGRVLGVVRLDPHQAGIDQLGNDRVAVGQAGMSEDGDAVRFADHLHRFHRREAPAGDVGDTALLEVLVERLAHRLHVAVLDHHLSDVRTAGRALLAHREDLGGLD